MATASISTLAPFGSAAACAAESKLGLESINPKVKVDIIHKLTNCLVDKSMNQY